MSAHAKLSPSSAARWLACAGSLKVDKPEDSNEFADGGTAAHTLASWTLPDPHKTTAYFRESTIDVRNEDGTLRRQFDVTEEMADYVQVYVDAVRDRVVGADQLLVEQRLDTGLESKRYGKITGTGDAVILHPNEKMIEVHDLKYGRGVKVFAKDNPQLLLYALGAMNDYGWLMPVERIKVAIHQPRLDHFDEHEYTVDELETFLLEVSEYVLDKLDAGDESLNPGEKQCKWCPRAATCPALGQKLTSFLSDFPVVADLTEYGIGKAMDEADLAEIRIAAVRAEARRLLDAGTKVPGWTLEEGRQGNRKWASEDQASGVLVAALGEAAYSKKLLSPADAEKKVAKKHPLVWQALQAYIVRGAPSINMVRDDGKRKPIAAHLDGFKEVK